MEIKIVGGKEKFRNVLVVLGGASGERALSLKAAKLVFRL